MSEATECFACLVFELGGEWSAADASAICFEDAEDFAYASGRYSESDASACTDGVGGGYERIGAEVDVEHGALCSFGEDCLARGEEVVDIVFAIDEGECFEEFDSFEPFFFDFVEVVGEVVVRKYFFVTCYGVVVFLLEVVFDVAYA